MCLSPILIRNPSRFHNLHPFYRSQSFLSDCESAYIYVPCGQCSQCIAVRQMYLVQRVMMEARDSFLYFTTLTYDNDHLPHLITSQDVSLPYADHSDLQLLFKRLRNNDSFGRPFRYLAVSERGKERSRPHFHILWFLPRYPGETLADGQSLNARLYSSILDYWCVNKGTRKFPIYEPLFTFHSRYLGRKLFSNYDTHFVLPSLTAEGVSSVAYYVSKYMLKVNPKETPSAVREGKTKCVS